VLERFLMLPAVSATHGRVAQGRGTPLLCVSTAAACHQHRGL